MSVNFRKISVEGTPEDIGFQTGTLLKDEIHHNSEFYIAYILEKISPQQLSKAVLHIKSLLAKFCPHLLVEIEHMASAAKIKPEYLFAMNARTELLLSPNYNECTAIAFPKKGISAQNWDWSSKLEDNSVVIEITKPNGLKIIQLTEAGVCGKIGMNNYGIGITLNILRTLDRNLKGVPVHIIMRCILECQTFTEVISSVKSYTKGTSSNLIILNSDSSINVEYGGQAWKLFNIESDFYVHTNHFIHIEGVSVDENAMENSLHRYNRSLVQLRENEQSIVTMKKILSDTQGEHPILSKYVPYLDNNMGETGTLATIVMDLNNGIFEVRKGNPNSKHFDINQYSKYQVID
jgi:isopenicillin-N N-acyltransferase-like protein